MEAPRSGFGPLLEWLIAAAVIALIMAAASVGVREFRDMRALTPVIAEERPAAEPPAGLPPRTVSVPMLVLVDGTELRIGDRLSEVATRIGQAAQLGPDVIERAAAGERFTRFYQYVGSRFALVLEKLDADNEPRVAAIYLQ